MTQPCTSPTVFGQQCSEKFVTLLAGRPLGGQLQLSTPSHSPENPCVASTPAMEVIVHAPSSTPRVAISVSKYGAASLEKDKTKLTSYHSSDVPKTLAECNRQLFTVKQGIGGLVAISSPAISCSKYSTAASMQSTPIHPTNMSSPSYSFPVVMSPFASYTTPVATNIFEDSLLKESPDLEMLSEVALQTSPSAAHRNFLLRHHQHVTAASPDEEDENDASQSLSYIQRNHVPCILRKRKSFEHNVGTSPSFSTEERKAFEEHCQQSFSPSMLLNVPLLHHQKSDYHKTKKKKRKSLEKGGRSFIASTPIRDGKATTFSPLTKSHDVAYDSYRDSGYLTRIEPHSGIYGSPGAYYDQQPSVKEVMSFHNSNLRVSAITPEWESYDENLMPPRKLKPSPTGSALKPVRPSEVFRDCRELSSEEFLHRYVLVQAIEKAKSGHYMKKSRFAPDWARFVYGLTDEQLEVTASAKQFLLKTQNRFL